MRIAVVSDIHGNLTALEAVLRDLRSTRPDLVVHAGDLVANGSSPAEVIDIVRDLNWPGVYGNTDEMLWRPERLQELAAKTPERHGLRRVLFQFMAPATLSAIGTDRLNWLRNLPARWSESDLSVVHAAPNDLWRAPLATATDDHFVDTYASLGTRFVVYGHIHHAHVRRLPTFTVANAGSLSLSYDGDPRAAYVVVNDGDILIRRVSYDVEREVARLGDFGYPFAAWLGEILRTGRYVPPPPDAPHHDKG
jgi:putative phosphoesterase